MKKLTVLLPLLLAACGSENRAELRVRTDVPKARCSAGILSDGTHVAKCDIPSADGKSPAVTTISAVGGSFPFQLWPYRTVDQLKEDAKARGEAEKQAAEQFKASGAGSGSNTLITPSTGSAAGSASGSAAKK